jgi:hypothetical protein
VADSGGRWKMIGAMINAAAPMLNPALANETPQVKMFVS